MCAFLKLLSVNDKISGQWLNTAADKEHSLTSLKHISYPNPTLDHLLK